MSSFVNWLCLTRQSPDTDKQSCVRLSIRRGRIDICTPFVKINDPLHYAFLCVDSIWSQCAHWWMTRSMNGWRVWRKTLRGTWDQDCSGTSNSSPGGPQTMWVSLSFPLSQFWPVGICPGAWISFIQPTKASSLTSWSFPVPLSTCSLCVV